MNAAVGLVAQQGVGVVHESAYVAQASVTISPSGHVLPTAWRAVVGATGARVDSAVLTVDPVTTGSGRDVGVVAAAKDPTTSITVTPPVAGVPTRALTIPSLRAAPDGDALPLSSDLHVVVRQGGTPVVAVPPLPADHYLPAQLAGGSISGSQLTLPDLVGPLTVSVAAGRTLDALTSLNFAHGDVRLRTAPMPVGLHVIGPDGDEQVAVPGPLRTTLTHDLAPALQRHLTAAVRDGTGGTAPVTLRSDATGDARVRLTVSGFVIERRVEGRPSVECEGAATSVPRPGAAPGRAPRHTRADVTVTHHGAALHPSSDPVPTADADVGGTAVRDRDVTRRIPAATLAGERLVRVAVVGWPHGETDLALTVAGATLTATALPGVDGRGAPHVVWFTLPAPAAVDGPVDVALRATRGTFHWYEPAAGSGPAVRVAVASSPVGTRVVVGGVRIDLTGPTTTVSGALLAGTDGWTVETDQLCAVTLADAVMEFAP